MVAGDVINVNMDGLTSFQPALTVELYIMKQFSRSTSTLMKGFTDGVTTTVNYSTATSAAVNWTDNWSKFGITNTNYFYTSAAVTEGGLSMIQIK